MDLIELIAALADGGVVSRARLIAHGADPREISALRHAGTLTVIRRGWYAITGADPAVVAAVRSGAALTCVSALRFAPGVWVPPGITRSHVRWPVHRAPAAAASRARTGRARDRAGGTPSTPGSTDRSARCHSHHGLAPPTRAVDPLPVALQCAANCLSDDYLVAVLDSTLRMPNPYSEADLREIFDGAPQRVLRLLDRLDPLAGSGTESVTRIRLQNHHVLVRSQVVIEGLGRVDLLVGEKLIVECDSRAFHNDAQRAEDNRRDRVATVGGYRVLRIDYAEVMFGWDAVFADVMDLVRTRRHRAPRTSRLRMASSDDTEVF